MKKLVIGILLSALFVYLSLRGLDFGGISASLEGVRPWYLLPAFALNVAVGVIRSLRWAVVLSPVARVRQKVLYPITSVGFMSIVLVPMRIGEFVRPCVLSVKEIAPFSSALATVFVERVLDVTVLLGIFVVAVLGSPLPAWLVKSGYSAIAFLAAMVGFMVLLYFRTEGVLRVVRHALGLLPERVGSKVEALLRQFVEGFRIVASPARLFETLFLSCMVWGLTGISVYCLFRFHNLDLPLIAAYVVLFVNIIGISLPAAPGMVGNFQYSVILALSIFAVGKETAFAFSMVYYLMGIGTVVLVGAVCLPFVDVSIREIFGTIRKGLGAR